MSENLLRHEASPYLLQHKDNPVHWRPWGPQPFAEAVRDGKPVLLSVGYAACHWCHVMAHESFEDPKTAAVMNRLFVNIKVDREERPDVDQIYMAALHALREQGGWPLTMFLTPAGEPIWGGTYFPPTAKYGRPGFVQVLEEIARVFREEPDKVAGSGRFIMERLLEAPSAAAAVEMGPAILESTAERLLGVMDPVNGGTRGAPKFPNAPLLDNLWRAGLRTGNPDHRDAVLRTLRAIAQGGVYDHVGGGFARYATDAQWLIPHFEKMLYDNAEIAELMTYAFIATGDALFRDRIGETIAWLEREMLTPEGAFAASLDADSEGHEGKFYVWTQREVIETLGLQDGPFFSAIYDATPDGNWEGGVSILNRIRANRRLSDAEEVRLATARARLLERRAKRVRPMTDDKILADWNGLMIAALAFAGATFGEPHWIGLAERAFAFVTTTMSADGRLAHAWRAAKGVFPGLASDYAAMTKAAIALNAATLDPQYLAAAEQLAATAKAHHWNADQPGYYLSADDATALIIRPRATTDEATPSATGLMGQNLVRLWRLTGNNAYRDDVDAILAANGAAVGENIFGSSSLLSALDLRLGATDLVIVAPPMIDPTPMITAARAAWTPNVMLSVHQGTAHLPPTHPASAKTAVDGKTTAYACRGEACSLPVTDTAQLAALLVPTPATAPA